MALRAVPDHPKFASFKSLIQQPKGASLGWLEMMWHFTGRFCPQGNIGKYTDQEIESWVEWDGEPGALVKAFIESRWIDTDPIHRLIVHDWAQHADKATKAALGRSKLAFCVPGVFPVGAQLEHTETNSGTVCVPPVPVPDPEPVPVPVPESEPTPVLASSEKSGLVSAPVVDQSKPQSIIDTWNTAIAGKLPHAKLTPKRAAQIKSRLKEPGWLGDFTTACKYLAETPWYTGQNDRQWIATIDFALQSGRATELAEKAAKPAPAGGTHGTQHHRTSTDQRYIAQLAARDAKRGSPNGATETCTDEELREMFGQ